tara:strand:- start:8054 stop:8401 length:348 start_codon:yes stop_codon:yes gene_type:complete
VSLALLPAIATAHSASNPVEDIHKYDRTIAERQKNFDQSQSESESESESEKMQNLRDQLNTVENKILAIRNLMANDYPHIKDDMSKYKFDYMESVDNILVQLKKTLTQADKLLNP